MKKRTIPILLTAMLLATGLMAVVAPGAAAADPYTLFGDAELVEPGNASMNAVQIRSMDSGGYGGIDFQVTEGMTFADITSLSTDYFVEADDTCAVGSPRFSIGLSYAATEDTGNIFVYFGTPSDPNLCTIGEWANTGEMFEATENVDTSQLDGGANIDPYSSALSKYGAYTVDYIQMVIDASYAFGDSEQTVLIDNTDVAGYLYTYDVTATDQLDSLMTSTEELVDNPGAERVLLAALNRTQTFVDNGQPFRAYMSMLQYVLLLNRYDRAGIIGDEAAQQLYAQALDVARALLTPTPPPPTNPA